jgi:hypothetical protein
MSAVKNSFPEIVILSGQQINLLRPVGELFFYAVIYVKGASVREQILAGKDCFRLIVHVDGSPDGKPEATQGRTAKCIA